MADTSTQAARPSQRTSPAQDEPASALPAWPLIALFGLFPVWWLLGVVDLAWIVLAVPMSLYLASTGSIRAPRFFPVWLLFLAWMLASSVQVPKATDAIEFGYRAAIYLSVTVLFLYVYNARGHLSDRFICALMSTYWLWTVLGGCLGLLLPTGRWVTPAFYVLRNMAPSIAANDFVNHMVVRRLAQFNPDSYLGVAPRPSAPFLYANNWGNAYSLLVPFVVAYLVQVRGERRFWVVGTALLASTIPAALTLNRGMFIGLGLAALYVAGRSLLRGRVAIVALLLLAAVVGVFVFNTLTASRLETRLQGSGTETRASLYQQALDSVPESPVFGFGVPPTSTHPDAPPVGTQGQFWMLLVSHGPVAVGAFMAWFLLAFALARRRRDAVGVAAATVLLVSVVELGFYGVVPYGIPIMMVAAALGTRGQAIRAPLLRNVH